MVYVEPVDLTRHAVVLPNDCVGMVFSQPHLSLTDIEPFQCNPATKAEQIACLDATLAVSRAASHGAGKTHFTIFPEYSIPGLEGVTRITDAMQAAEWPTGTVVIGGTDGLSREDFATLALSKQPQTFQSKSADDLTRITANEWVNCGIIWVKGADGVVARWLQPKLHPAWPEQDIQYQEMFKGQSVFVFEGRLENGAAYRFSMLVCFDWIAENAGRKLWRWVTDDLDKRAKKIGGEFPLSWFFVIQRNKRPSHNSFLMETRAFFDRHISPSARRERTCLAFVNAAGKNSPGRVDEFGGTSLVFSKSTLFDKPKCHPTFSNGGMKFRSSTLLDDYRDVFFREGGACIHSFAQINPDSLNAGAAGRSFAVDRAFVYPMHGATEPRTPSGEVPASVKWLNDELDALPNFGTRHSRAALAATAQSAHNVIIGLLRALPGEHAAAAVRLATCHVPERDADDWDQPEKEALEHLVHTLDIFNVGGCNITIKTVPSHAIVTLRGRELDLIVVRGDTHAACNEHSRKKFVPFPRRNMLLVSRDHENSKLHHRSGSFLEPSHTLNNEERTITNPQSGSLHLDYARLLEIFQGATTPAEVEGAIHDELTA